MAESSCYLPQREKPPVPSTWVDAIVTAVDPFRVRLDGDTSALPFTPDALVDSGALAVDDRVRCELSGNRLVVHGRAGGSAGGGGFLLGVAYPWMSDTVPSWGLELNGQTITGGVATYSGLAGLYPDWVSGNDLVLPDWGGRVPVGEKSGDTNFGTLGATAGEATHTLTEAEMPSHTHVQESHRHSNKIAVVYGGNASTYRSIFATNHAYWGWDAHSATASVTAVNENTGEDSPHNIVQPSITVKWVVCAATSSGDFDTEVQTALVGRVSAVETSVAAVTDYSGANRPAFQAHGGGLVAKSGAANLEILVLAEELDQGDCYNPTTGRFTAPAAGLYQFNFYAVQITAATGPGFYIFLNGVSQGEVMIGYGVAYKTTSASKIMSLNVGDVVDLRWSNYNNTSVTLDRSRCGFSGYYLG